MGFERMVLSQVSDKFLRQATKGGSLVHAEKYSRASNSKVKAETHIPWAFSEGERISGVQWG